LLHAPDIGDDSVNHIERLSSMAPLRGSSEHLTSKTTTQWEHRDIEDLEIALTD